MPAGCPTPASAPAVRTPPVARLTRAFAFIYGSPGNVTLHPNCVPALYNNTTRHCESTPNRHCEATCCRSNPAFTLRTVLIQESVFHFFGLLRRCAPRNDGRVCVRNDAQGTRNDDVKTDLSEQRCIQTAYRQKILVTMQAVRPRRQRRRGKSI